MDLWTHGSLLSVIPTHALGGLQVNGRQPYDLVARCIRVMQCVVRRKSGYVSKANVQALNSEQSTVVRKVITTLGCHGVYFQTKRLYMCLKLWCVFGNLLLGRSSVHILSLCKCISWHGDQVDGGHWCCRVWLNCHGARTLALYMRPLACIFGRYCNTCWKGSTSSRKLCLWLSRVQAYVYPLHAMCMAMRDRIWGVVRIEMALESWLGKGAWAAKGFGNGGEGGRIWTWLYRPWSHDLAVEYEHQETLVIVVELVGLNLVVHVQLYNLSWGWRGIVGKNGEPLTRLLVGVDFVVGGSHGLAPREV